MPQKQHARQLGADRAGFDDCLLAESELQLPQIHIARQVAERRLQRQRLVQRVHRLGARVAFEFFDEIVRYHPGLADDLVPGIRGQRNAV
jgi:hypothetical protein